MKFIVTVPRVLTFLTLLLSFPLHAATFLYLNSEAGDYVGQGVEKTVNDIDQVFTATKNPSNGVSVDIFGPLTWATNFAAAGKVELAPGYYESATRYPFQTDTDNGLSIYGEGKGCNTLTGRFFVHEVSFNAAGGVDSFAADFEQSCGGSTSKLTGSVRVNSNIPIATLPVSVTVSPADYAYATDGGANFDWTMDGIFDVMTKGGDVLVTKYRSLDFTKWLERRGGYEFALPSILADPSVTVVSATLVLPTITSGGASGAGDYLTLYGYSADGTLQLDDFSKTDISLGTTPISTSDHVFDVTPFVDSISATSSHVGFNLAVSWWDAYVTMGGNAELKIVYAVNGPAVNTDPVITINSPSASATYYEDTPVTVSATAFDQEDGDITSNLSWSSPYFQLETAGPSFTTSIFYPGTHYITASVTDSAGATVIKQVMFTVQANTPPTLSVISPEPNGSFYVGEGISFQAIASDNEDGDVSNSITWSSSIDGAIGTGGQLNVTSLSQGTHTIFVTASDTSNATVTNEFTVNIYPVLNSVPTITVISPVNFSVIPSGQATTLQANATDLEDGDLTSTIQWSSTIDGFVGQGGSVSGVFLTPGNHLLTAIVFDSLGQSASFVSSITVTDSTPLYCAAKGNYTNYEWAESVSIAGINKITGANGGYVDLTSEPAIDLVPGSNSMTFTPGFSGGSYNEYWGVWIDLNEDFQFTADEQFYSGNSNTVINSTISLPAGIYGNKRMRVVMKYGSPANPCGSFTYGEVEDYTVNILDSIPPPEPTPVPSNYCKTSGSSTGWEWIESVSGNGYSFISGNNGGYFDHTNDTAMNLNVGTNDLTLSPGFASGSYTEIWNVWIDFNHDNTFTSDEKLYSGSSNTVVNALLSVPATALKGPTRMRVNMSYGSPAGECNTFQYGEAEDFTVIIN